jgi:hypothetical protein
VTAFVGWAIIIVVVVVVVVVDSSVDDDYQRDVIDLS